MIELVTVEAHNFRSFGEAVFAPLGAGLGLTAINGGNGTGKSSIATHAVLWALYGVTPDGVNVKALRRQGSDGEVRVTVTFRHNGQDVVATRSLRGKNDTTTASITVDGVEQTNISARTATAWMEARLGVDAEAFLTAFVVRQKELDGLVRARPAERRALIERLAGIDRLSAALAHAREDARRKSAQANNITVDGDPAVLASDADQAALVAEEVKQTAASMNTKAAQLSTAADEADSAVSQAEQQEATIQSCDDAVASARLAADSANRDRDRLAAAASGADLLPDAEAAAEDARLARQEAETSIRDAGGERERAEQAERTASALRNVADEAASKADMLRRAADDAVDNAHQFADNLVDLQLDAEKEATEAHAHWLLLDAETTRLTDLLSALNQTVAEGHAECPTCSQHLNAPESLLEAVQADAARRREEADKARARADETRSEADRLKGQVEAQRAAQQAAQQAVQAAVTAEKVAEAEERRATAAEEEAETAAEAAHRAVLASQEAERSLAGLVAEEKAATVALRKAENAAEAAAALPAAESEAQTAADALQEALGALYRAQQQHTGPKAQEARKAAQEARKAAHAAALAAQEAAAAAALAQRDAALARDRADRAASQVDAKRTALQEAEVAAAVASGLEEFRLDRLARLAPELSEIASDGIATMTEGRFNAVELDEDFTPTVVEAATGLQRPVSWLSGGEESAVALALRLAIGEVVAGQAGGVLILDEVLTAHDKDRRAAVMSAIRALPHRQVITINHASEATDQVDLIAHVLPTEDGSVIEHNAPDVPTDIAGLDLPD